MLKADGVEQLEEVAHGEGEVGSVEVVSVLDHEDGGSGVAVPEPPHLVLHVVEVRSDGEERLRVQQQQVLPLQPLVTAFRQREEPGIQTDRSLYPRLLPTPKVGKRFQRSGCSKRVSCKVDFLNRHRLQFGEHLQQQVVALELLEHCLHFCGSAVQVLVAAVVKHGFEDVVAREEFLVEVDADAVVVVLEGEDDVAVRSPPAAEGAVVVEVGAQSVAEHHHPPPLLLLVVVHVQRGVAQHRHLHPHQVGHDELEQAVGQPQLGGVHEGDVVQHCLVLLRRDPLGVLSVRHRGVEDGQLQGVVALPLVGAVARIVGALPHDRNVVELDVVHQQDGHQQKPLLRHLPLQEVSQRDAQEDGRVGTGSLYDVADCPHQADRRPEVQLVVVRHHQHALHAEQEQEQDFKRVEVLLHLLESQPSTSHYIGRRKNYKMGGCLDKPKPKKSKIAPAPKPHPDSSKMPSRQSLQVEAAHMEQVKPKYRRMTTHELLCTYRIQCTLELSCKLQGPKYLSNLVDGSSRVLRVLPPDISEKRLEVYRRLAGFDIYENQEACLMILDQYWSGEDVYEAVDSLKNQQAEPQSLLDFLQQVVAIVDAYHASKTWLGNLTLSSFRRASAFGGEVKLVDYNLSGAVGDHEKMGFAHRDSYEADYQFLGYLCQLLLASQPPIFVPHKMQYVQLEATPCAALIQKLLRGSKWLPTDFGCISPAQIIGNTRVACGYKFRRDVNKLLKMRRKRKAHNRRLYGEDAAQWIMQTRFQEEGVYRMEAERIFSRIGGYLSEVNSLQEEAFMNYAGNNDNMRRLKEVFLLVGDKKMAELRDCLSTMR